MNSNDLKSLTTRLNAVRDQRAVVLRQQAVLMHEDQGLVKQESQIQSEIDKLKAKAVVVSEHAIVRYMERVHGIDLEHIKREILGTDKEVRLPNGQFGVRKTHKIRVKDGVVVTVITKDNQKG